MLIYCNGIIFHLGFKDSGFSPPLIHLGNIKNVDFCPICPPPNNSESLDPLSQTIHSGPYTIGTPPLIEWIVFWKYFEWEGIISKQTNSREGDVPN